MIFRTVNGGNSRVILPMFFFYALVVLTYLSCCNGNRSDSRRSTSSSVSGRGNDETGNRTGTGTGGGMAQSNASTGGGGGWPENCTHCNVRQVKRSYRMETIKADILRKLRLSAPPNVTGKQLPEIPQIQRIMEQHTYQNDSPGHVEDEDTTGSFDGDQVNDAYATTISLILFAQPAPAEVAGNNNSSIFYFHFQPEITHQTIVRANLGIYIRRVSYSSIQSTWILIYRVNRFVPGESQERELIRKKRINLTPTDTGQWHRFDMKVPVTLLVQNINTSYGLLVQASDGRGEPLAIVSPLNRDEELLKPFLEIHVKEQATMRTKRTTEIDCDEHSAEKKCCRYPLVVDFEAFQWNWVIVPKRYSAYYCSGDCPLLFRQRYPHTGIVQQAANHGSGGPCCSPKKVSAISMLYYDDFMNIVYGRLPGMVVDQCGCS